MKWIRFIFIALSCLSHGAWALVVHDDMGNAVSVPNSVHRIVSLSPEITEILYAIGKGNALVAVDMDSDYPALVKTLPKVGGYQNINVEAIVALKPDVVVAWPGISQADIASIARFHIPVYIVNITSIPGIAIEMKALGQLTRAKEADTAANQFMAEYQDLKNKYSQQRPVRVLMEVSDAPLYTVSDKTVQGQAIELCGGKNIFGDLPGYASQINPEDVIALNPQVIIGLSPVDLSYWQTWPEVDAVKNKRLYIMDANLLARNSPKILQGINIMCNAIRQARKQS